jgi:putative ABC transport system substrate-binding protein
MRRREFITLVGGAAAWPLAARAQQDDRMRQIGALITYPEADPEGERRLEAFRNELQKLGWWQGRNVLINLRSAGLDAQLLQQYAKELVAMRPDLILSQNTTSTAALRSQTSTIPIIFAAVSDPVGGGFVASLPRPGGNITGFLNIEGSLGGKWVELLKEIAPGIRSVAFLHHPVSAPFAEIYLKSFKASAASLAVEAVVAPVRDTSELDVFVGQYARRPNGGLIVMPDTFMTSNRAQIVSLAARHRLPAAYTYRFIVEDGGLLSYGFDLANNYRRAASYADRILKGAKPSELPVQAQDKFELVINLKTAKALGLDVPFLLQQRADEVIE